MHTLFSLLVLQNGNNSLVESASLSVCVVYTTCATIIHRACCDYRCTNPYVFDLWSHKRNAFDFCWVFISIL